MRARELRVLTSGVAIITVIGASAILMPACFGRQCDGDTVSWGPPPDVFAAAADASPDAADADTRLTEGKLLDENTWESNDENVPWLAYPHERTWNISYPQLGARQPDQFTAYISADPTPNASNQSLTEAGGNVAKWFNVIAGSAAVRNDTCADYYVRIVVHAPPYVDAGLDASDAGLDASDADAADAGDAADAADAH